MYLETDVALFGVRLNEGGRESERKKIKLNVTFIIIRVELKESIS